MQAQFPNPFWHSVCEDMQLLLLIQLGGGWMLGNIEQSFPLLGAYEGAALEACEGAVLGACEEASEGASDGA